MRSPRGGCTRAGRVRALRWSLLLPFGAQAACQVGATAPISCTARVKIYLQTSRAAHAVRSARLLPAPREPRELAPGCPPAYERGRASASRPGPSARRARSRPETNAPSQSPPPGTGLAGSGLSPSPSLPAPLLFPFTVAIAVRNASNSASTEGRFRKMNVAAARTSL